MRMAEAVPGTPNWRWRPVAALTRGAHRLIPRRDIASDDDVNLWILRRIPSAAELLVLGPASTQLLKLLAERGTAVDVAGVDSAEARKLRNLCRKAVTGMPRAVTDGQAGSRPWILATGLFNTAEDPAAALAEAARLLRPGGRMLLSLPAARAHEAASTFIAAGLRVRREEYTTPMIDAGRIVGPMVRAMPVMLAGHANFELATSRVIIPPARQ